MTVAKFEIVDDYVYYFP